MQLKLWHHTGAHEFMATFLRALDPVVAVVFGASFSRWNNSIDLNINAGAGVAPLDGSNPIAQLKKARALPDLASAVIYSGGGATSQARQIDGMVSIVGVSLDGTLLEMEATPQGGAGAVVQFQCSPNDRWVRATFDEDMMAELLATPSSLGVHAYVGKAEARGKVDIGANGGVVSFARIE
ncbi:hypothetical protein Rsub_04808 [Raphidocelis subcapitata]|uniref:Uncharacterized protein n=1 Tax=Raphidocelis subcapitata TaxID=307507 RepID=A0A2V0NUX4_9CHLO|nr:hypothetical protein Rsub_04808 [Raphidocelis subcapitata]|eukprot:GBF91139.1 hypothetical protein Rsub_04808 [Raphidocelis subcapitata]